MIGLSLSPRPRPPIYGTVALPPRPLPGLPRERYTLTAGGDVADVFPLAPAPEPARVPVVTSPADCGFPSPPTTTSTSSSPTSRSSRRFRASTGRTRPSTTPSCSTSPTTSSPSGRPSRSTTRRRSCWTRPTPTSCTTSRATSTGTRCTPRRTWTGSPNYT